MSASAVARLIVASRCALSDRLLSASARRSSATRVQRKVGVDSCQKRQKSVCSAVLRVLPRLPNSLTSLYSAAYSALSSAGGPAGRNAFDEGIPHGVMMAHCGSRPGANPGSVGRHWPVSPPPRYGGGGGVNPSPLRQARIDSATNCPHSTPRSSEFPPPAIAASEAVRLALRSAA